MSKKEILNRLNRTRGETRRGWTAPGRSGTPSTPGASSGEADSEKRVSGTVIRRRRRPAPPKLGADGPPAKPMSTAAPRRRKPVQADQTEQPPVQAEQAAPPAEQLRVEGEAPLEAPVLPTLGGPVEPALHRAAVPRDPDASQPGLVGADTGPADASEHSGDTAEPGSDPGQVDAPPAAAAEAGSQVAPDANAPGAGTAAPGTTPTGKPRFDGLGAAVVKPPPGYDPNDPLGSRRRAREAAEASVRATRSTEGPRWTAPTPGAEEGKKDAKTDRTRGRPRRKPRRAGRVEMLMDDMPSTVRRKRRTRRAGPKKASPQAKAIKRRVQVDGDITVGQLAKSLSVKAGQVIQVLMGLGQAARINDIIDLDTAQLVAADFDFEVVDVTFKEEEHMIQIETAADDGDKEPRPAVITIMGHVDHGKTSLLDYIRKAKVAAGEAGGITQHISAYQFQHEGELVTFIDTPGHAAFTEMRARGANATDIVILVVAADDGVMPQTIESINHTRAADVPIVVAINKCDKKGVNPAVVRQRLLEHDLVPEEFGGDTLMVDVSAITGQGIPELLDAVTLQAEMLELGANADRHAEGIVLEARLEKGRGPVATIIVQKGTLKRSDSIVVGTTHGRIRALTDFRGKKLKKAGPSTPVEIMGLDDVPVAGDHFTVVGNDKAAKALAEHRFEAVRQGNLTRRQKLTFEELLSQAQGAEIKNLNLVVKADVQGSLEALKGSLDRLQVEGVQLKVLHDGVGAISESDITLASTYGAVVVGFSIRPDPKARRAAEQQGVEIKTYKVIYELLDDIRAAMVGMLSPIVQEEYLGTAEVRATFNVPKVGTVAGCYVQDGHILRSGLARLVRDGVEVWEGKLASLKRFKDDVREVQSGFECGLGLEGFNDIKVGDTIQVFRKIEVAAQG